MIWLLFSIKYKVSFTVVIEKVKRYIKIANRMLTKIYTEMVRTIWFSKIRFRMSKINNAVPGSYWRIRNMDSASIFLCPAKGIRISNNHIVLVFEGLHKRAKDEQERAKNSEISKRG